jgi:hypothetical protein
LLGRALSVLVRGRAGVREVQVGGVEAVWRVMGEGLGYSTGGCKV